MLFHARCSASSNLALVLQRPLELASGASLRVLCALLGQPLNPREAPGSEQAGKTRLVCAKAIPEAFAVEDLRTGSCEGSREDRQRLWLMFHLASTAAVSKGGGCGGLA